MFARIWPQRRYAKLIPDAFEFHPISCARVDPIHQREHPFATRRIKDDKEDKEADFNYFRVPGYVPGIEVRGHVCPVLCVTCVPEKWHSPRFKFEPLPLVHRFVGIKVLHVFQVAELVDEGPNFFVSVFFECLIVMYWPTAVLQLQASFENVRCLPCFNNGGRSPAYPDAFEVPAFAAVRAHTILPRFCNGH